MLHNNIKGFSAVGRLQKGYNMKKILLAIITLCLILGTTAFAANDDLTANVSITNLAGYGGILEIYQDEEVSPFITQVIPSEATSVTVENLEQGNYRAVIRGGVAVYEELKFVILTTYNSETGCYETEDVVLTAKFEEPELTKLADRKTAKVGDRIKYTLQIALPEYAPEDEEKTCIIGDMGGEGLAIDESTVKFYPCDENYQKAGEAIQMSDVSTIVMDPEEGMKIEITDYTSFRERVNGNLLVVEYEAVVTENAGNLKSTENYAYLEWRDGFDDDFKEVFTYRIKVLKKDKDGNSLAGAVFTLSQNGSLLKFQTETVDGYYVLYPDQTETDTSKYITEIPVDENGILLVKGLDLGTYTLREVKAPEGYFLSTEAISIVLQDNEPDGHLDLGTLTADKPNQVEVTVYNYKTIFDVPVTGSASFGQYVALGSIFICLGLGLVLYGKKTRRS